MVKNHLKRIATPKTWSILRKNNVFVTRPNPGAHTYSHALSLNTLLKEVVGVANTTKEVKRILHEQEVLVDGKKRHDERFNVGFLDVVSLPSDKKYFRVGISKKGKLNAFDIDEKESKQKVSRIIGKRTIKGGKFQIEFNDGRNIVVDKSQYAVGDSLLLELPKQTIKKHFPLAKGSYAIFYEGKYAGSEGVIESVADGEVVLSTDNGTVSTKQAYTYVVGDKKPELKCSQ